MDRARRGDRSDGYSDDQNWQYLSGRRGGRIEDLLQELAGLPPGLFYLAVGIGAAIENIVPPIPADTFILFGAFLAAAGRASAVVIFLVTWIANLTTAIGVYALSWRYGPRIVGAPITRWALRPHQLGQLSRFYERHGLVALAITRFLPALRAVVPIFAGVSRTPWYRVVPPIGIASALWYGILVAIGTIAGENWDLVMAVFRSFSRLLLSVAIPLLIIIFVWWLRTRRGPV